VNCDYIFKVSILYTFFEVTCIPKDGCNKGYHYIRTVKVVEKTIKVIEKGDNYIRIAKFVEASFSSFM
jgi:hypothetical protein